MRASIQWTAIETELAVEVNPSRERTEWRINVVMPAF